LRVRGMRGLVVEFARCGWGRDDGLFPEIRLGFVRVMITREPIVDALRGLLTDLRAAHDELRMAQRPRVVQAPPPAWERQP
jgi:hypothetical protein